MKLSKSEVIVRLCKLVTLVGEKAFDHTVYHDCFCKDSTLFASVDEEVIARIEQIIVESLSSGFEIGDKVTTLVAKQSPQGSTGYVSAILQNNTYALTINNVYEFYLETEIARHGKKT